MTLLFVVMALSILLGSIFLWFSGYFSGSAAGGSQDTSGVPSGVYESLKEENERLQKLADDAVKNRESQVVDDAGREAEVAKLTSELARAEGEKDRAQLEVENLQDEIVALKEKATEKPASLPKPPPPTPGSDQPMPESDAVDALQAELDMEKVSHQKTKDELAQVKKIAAVKMATSPTFGTSGGGGDTKGKSRFQTMAFNTRSAGAGGGSNDILKGALDKVQAEKTSLQAELDRAKKEIQILKMRGK